MCNDDHAGQELVFSVEQVFISNATGEWIAPLQYPRFGRAAPCHFNVRGYSWTDLVRQVNRHVDLYLSELERSSGRHLVELRAKRRALKKPRL